MKRKSKNQKSKSGGVLLMAMLVLLAFSVLAVGLHRMSTVTGLDAINQDHAKNAFWLAESGLQDALQRLAFDSSFRALAQGASTSFTVSNATDKTRYDVTVTDTGGGNLAVDYYVYNVDSVGRKGGMNRRIRQGVTTQPGFISAIMSPGNISVDANTLITGPIMVLDNGTIILDDKIPPGQDLEGDYDIVILDDGASINDKKSNANEGSDYDVVDLPVPDSLPEMPRFTGAGATTDYKANAQNPALSTVIVTNTSLDEITLSPGAVTYYDCPELTVKKISGSGVLVNTGDLIIGDAVIGNNDVSSDVAILSFEDVVVTKQSNLGNNTLIYAFETLYFGDGSYGPGNSAILADGGTAGPGVVQDSDDIIMGGQSEFMGIVFADEGNVVIQAGSGGANNTRIEGSVIAAGDVDMNSNSEIMFNPDVFYDGDLFDLGNFFNTGVITTKITWEELTPL